MTQSRSKPLTTRDGDKRQASPKSIYALLATLLAVLVFVPLALSNTFYRTIVFPKCAVLIFGSALVLFMLTLLPALEANWRERLQVLKSRIVLFVLLYVLSIGVSTFFGVARRVSFFGSYDSEMGLVSHVCFLILFVGLIVAIGDDETRLNVTLGAIALTGLIVAAYSFAQFAGRDPFLSPSLYTFPSSSGPVLRVPGTLGHSNYLGNFLLYTTPVTAAFALASSGSARRIGFAGVALSIAGIVFSGTRGAWLGLIGGAVVFIVIESRGREAKARLFSRRNLVSWIAASSIVLVALAVLVISPRSRGVLVRARSFVTDGLTGSGRTILWRDAIKMAPAFAATGCGPEGFSKAFLPYKSDELARTAPQINNESSHNGYIDAAISYGLAGAILQIAIIALAFAILLRARRQAE